MGSRRGVTLLATIVLASFLLPATALAHATLLRSDPPDGRGLLGISRVPANEPRCAAGAVLATPPQSIHLWFSEPVKPFAGGIAVIAPSGRRVEQGPVQAGNAELSIGLDGHEEGTYRVRWGGTRRYWGGFPFGLRAASRIAPAALHRLRPRFRSACISLLDTAADLPKARRAGARSHLAAGQCGHTRAPGRWSAIVAVITNRRGPAAAFVDGYSTHATSGGPAWLGLPVNAVHLAARRSLDGGLAALLAVWNLPGLEGRRSEALQGFGRLAALSLALLAGSGTLMAWLHLKGPADLFTVGYGRALFARTMMVVPVCSPRCRRRVEPRFRLS